MRRPMVLALCEVASNRTALAGEPPVAPVWSASGEPLMAWIEWAWEVFKAMKFVRWVTEKWRGLERVRRRPPRTCVRESACERRRVVDVRIRIES